MDTGRLRGEGHRSLVQFPHPGSEHDPGTRPWRPRLKRIPHARTFLQSPGTYRHAIEGSDHRGDVAFWGEWEGGAEVIHELEPQSRVEPKWLCRPDPLCAPPPSPPPPQNTDPFVWGDAIIYTACKQDTNKKLRRLGRGAVVLFGSRLKGAFVLDTVLVVAGYVDHNHANFREVLAGIASPAHMRMTLEPWYASGVETTFRNYVGATPDNPVDGMISFAPCVPADGPRSGFVRPAIELDPFIKPGLAMGARTSDPLEPAQIAQQWRRVADQVLDQKLGKKLALATHLDLPQT